MNADWKKLPLVVDQSAEVGLRNCPVGLRVRSLGNDRGTSPSRNFLFAGTDGPSRGNLDCEV